MPSKIKKKVGKIKMTVVSLKERDLPCVFCFLMHTFQSLFETFNRMDSNDVPVKCSTYFHPNDEERKRRSTGGLDLMPDMDTEIEKCEIAAEEAEDMGEECVDCCEKVKTQHFHSIFMILY